MTMKKISREKIMREKLKMKLKKKNMNSLQQIKDINTRINSVKILISNEFYNNGIHRSSCLAQSYIFYRYLLNMNINVKLIKGFIVNPLKKIYYGHFWVEIDNNIYDIATDTYLLDYNKNDHNKIKKMRILVKNISESIINNYANIDEPSFELIRCNSYRMCINNEFLIDLKKMAPKDVYNKIKKIHDLIIFN